jgi:nitrite reductase (NADH) small subunit
MEFYICGKSELEEKKPYMVNINELIFGVVMVKGQVYAYENRCPHFEGPVCLGDVRGKPREKLNAALETCGEYESDEEFNLICPWHGLEFDVASGQCIPEPAYTLRKFEAYEKDNQVYVKI